VVFLVSKTNAGKPEAVKLTQALLLKSAFLEFGGIPSSVRFAVWENAASPMPTGTSSQKRFGAI
jgi:hypothetical protein